MNPKKANALLLLLALLLAVACGGSTGVQTQPAATSNQVQSQPTSTEARAQAQRPPIPIPGQADAQPVPVFVGQEAAPKSIAARPIPDNPFMAPGSWSCYHSDSYMSDTQPVPGPLGHSPIVTSSFLGSLKDPVASVLAVSFDGAGRMVAVLYRRDLAAGKVWLRLQLIDPVSLAPGAWLDLPPYSTDLNNISDISDLPVGSYWYRDEDYRFVVATTEDTIWVVSLTGDTFTHERTYDLAGVTTLQPDWSGRLWFTSGGGVVGTLDMDTGEVLGTLTLAGEEIANGSAADETGGVYIVSTQAMYRFDADQNGAPTLTWREPYDAGTTVKEGMLCPGSGTTPTLMGEEYVTITDNADPRMHVLVYRRAKEVQGPRLVCAQPVLQPETSQTFNSLIATDRSVIVANNFGYTGPEATKNGATTEPGIARVDVDEGGGCHTVWTNMEVTIPSALIHMSLATGLIYAYTRDKEPGTTDAWYFTAIDFETGEAVYKRLVGRGALYDNDFSGVFLGPDGTAYVGLIGGLVAIRDGPPKAT